VNRFKIQQAKVDILQWLEPKAGNRLYQKRLKKIIETRMGILNLKVNKFYL